MWLKLYENLKIFDGEMKGKLDKLLTVVVESCVLERGKQLTC